MLQLTPYVDRTLLNAYRDLAADLSQLIGFPVTVRPTARNEQLDGHFRRSPANEYCYRLPGQQRPAIAELILPERAGTDSFATTIAARFARLCIDIASEAKRPRDVLGYLLRNEQFLWDHLVVTRRHSSRQKYALLDLIYALRDALSFRYEGEAVAVGCLVTWNWQPLKALLRESGCTILKFGTSADLRSRLRQSKFSHLLADGTTSFYMAFPSGKVEYLVALPRRFGFEPGGDWELVPRAYRYLQHILRGQDVFIASNTQNELWFFSGSDALKWSRSRWSRVSNLPLTHMFSALMPEECAQKLSEVILLLATRRVGALIVVPANALELLAQGSAGVGAELAHEIFSADISRLSPEFLARLAGIDGAMIIAQSGKLINAGVILTLPADLAVGEGARTAAAKFASRYGLAVKVSHDGPVSIYLDGVLQRQAA